MRWPSIGSELWMRSRLERWSVPWTGRWRSGKGGRDWAARGGGRKHPMITRKPCSNFSRDPTNTGSASALTSNSVLLCPCYGCLLCSFTSITKVLREGFCAIFSRKNELANRCWSSLSRERRAWTVATVLLVHCLFAGMLLTSPHPLAHAASRTPERTSASYGIVRVDGAVTAGTTAVRTRPLPRGINTSR